MLQALYDFSHGYWGFFLYYWIFVTVVMASRQFFALIFYQLFNNGMILADKPVKRNVTMFVTVFDEDPDTVIRGLSSVRASFDKYCSKFVMIIIIDGADLFPDVTKAMVETVTPFADVVLTTNARKKRQNLRNMVREAKKLGILYEISAFLDSDTVLDDNKVARELLRPFANPKIGGVTTAQRGLNPVTIPERIGDWLENARLFSSMAAGSLFGQVGCLPGRLYAVRSSIVEDKMDELVEDYWYCPLYRKRVQCVAGDDRVISNWVLQAGYKTVMMPTAGVRTVLPATWSKMLKTWERWGRSSQGYTLRTLSWSWRTPWVLYQNMTDILMTLATVYLMCFNWPLSMIMGEDDRPTWFVALGLAVAGMTLTVLVRQLVYLSFHPKQILIVPFFVVAITLGQFARFKALLTPHRIGVWGTRNGADKARADDVWVASEYVSPKVLDDFLDHYMSDKEVASSVSSDGTVAYDTEVDSDDSETESSASRGNVRRRLVVCLNFLIISGTVALLLVLASAPSLLTDFIGGLKRSNNTFKGRYVSVSAFVGSQHNYSAQVTESEYGVSLDEESYYQNLGALNINQCENAFASGKDCVITCQFRADYWVLPSIRDGEFDEALLEFSNSVKSFMAAFPSRKFYLRPLHEFNGDWYNWGTLYHNNGTGWNGNLADIPYQVFKDAWVHLVTLMRSTGAPISFQLSYNSNNGHNLTDLPFENWYPGDDFVDQVVIHGFNRAMYDRKWKTFDQIFAKSYAQIASMTQKDIRIGEMSTVPSRRQYEEALVTHSEAKADWIKDAFAKILSDYPRLTSVSWFLENKLGEFDGNFYYWGLNSDAEVAAFREGVESLHFSP